MEKEKIIIGYQGIEFCNNYFAMLDMLEKMKSKLPNKQFEVIPLEHSDRVVDALKKGVIDYGSMAFTTDLGIEVQETKEACAGLEYEIVEESTIDVHHCLFKKSVDIANEDIRKVSSHPEAIRECTAKISEYFPKAIHIPYETTGVAAKALGEGILSEDTAVVCSKEAGEKYGLYMVKENAENIHPNNTYFYMIKLK